MPTAEAPGAADAAAGGAVDALAGGAVDALAGGAVDAPVVSKPDVGGVGADAPVAAPDLARRCDNVRCVFEHADSSCEESTGRCSPPQCHRGYGDCDGQPGCESRLDTNQRCGSCTRACEEGFVCGANQSCECSPARTCGASQCVDFSTNPLHCGRCSRQCAGACAAGTCACVTTGPRNLFRNGGFDTGIGALRGFPGNPLEVTWQRQDVSDCANSGAARLRLTEQSNSAAQVCVPGVAGNVLYDVGAMIKVNEVSFVSTFIAVLWSPQPDCAGTPDSEHFDDLAEVRTSWHLSKKALRAPGYARSVVLQLSLIGEVGAEALYDAAFVTPSPGGFLD